MVISDPCNISFASEIQISSLQSVLPTVCGLIFWVFSQSLICGGQRPHTDSSRIILTSGLQVGCAYERPNTTVAGLTCCSLFLFSSHIFCTMGNSPPQQAAPYRASACHCSSPPQWPNCPSIERQDNIDQRKVSNTSGALGKSRMCCHVRHYPSGCSGSNHLFIPGPENWKLMLTMVLSSAMCMGHCPTATGWSWCEGHMSY